MVGDVGDRGNAEASRASKNQENHGGDVSGAERLDAHRADEGAIIARCLAGERTAYAVLVERYKGLIHGLVYRMLGDAEEAEDIAQDAFVRAYLKLGEFRGEARFSTWLCHIALNRCKDVLRRRRRVRWLPLTHEEPGSSSEAADDVESPVASLERRERDALLQRALAQLPVKYREAVVLRHLEGMEFTEMSALLGIPAGAVKVRTFRGREMLKRLLECAGFRDDTI
jgi:RNA polymerase sigma-70 factor, ECF subfamily